MPKMRRAVFVLLAAGLGIAAQAKTVWIDVRTPEEYAAGHVAGAANMPVEEILEQIAHSDVAKDDTILLYCRSGRRSGIAQSALLKAGYEKAQNIGGFDDLAATGAVKTE